MATPTIVQQGKTVIEAQAPDGFLVMHPDGSVAFALTKQYAVKLAHRWYRSALGTGMRIGVGQIEWRNGECS